MAGSQDMFDAIVMADERFHGEGYQEGYEEGNSLGIIEGRQYGTLHGAKIGSEIGCYQGFASAWRCLLHTCTTEKDSNLVEPRADQRLASIWSSGAIHVVGSAVGRSHPPDGH
ncbi:protein LTO1 homolog isoform X2 [Canis lupus dingo]|uniref:protein LTO1 homolog isoform X2 n=1 Tax=Canis lupus dingo TaxID=286419 RepID=UPI000DC6A05D|nr:protein LTO1 homolog isoform X2 [Canis lupus dingo]